MTEKATMIKQLKFYVDTYKKEEIYHDGELSFCGLFTAGGVHVSGVDNVLKIAKYLDVAVEVSDFNHATWTKEVSAMYENVRFFSLGTDAEVEEINV